MKKLNFTIASIILISGISIGFWGGRYVIGVPERIERQPLAFSDNHENKDVDHSGHADAQARKLAGGWCAEHKVPESECTQCNADLIPDFKAANDWCVEHGLPESHCRLCNQGVVFPQETRADLPEPYVGEASIYFRQNAGECATNNAIIQFANVNTLERAGLTIEPALQLPLAKYLEVPAEIVFDQMKTVNIATTVAASLTTWIVQPGDQVKAGDGVALLTSPEIAQLKADYIEAQSEIAAREPAYKRNKKLFEEKYISEQDFQETKLTWDVARARLVRIEGLLIAAGLNRDDLSKIFNEGILDGTFILRASTDGTIVKSQAILGDLMEAGTSIVTISNSNAVWIEAYIKDRDISNVRVGQRLEFISGNNGAERSIGEIIWVSQYLEPGTKTATARARLLSDTRLLHPGEFGQAYIYTDKSSAAILVPKDAVQWEGCCNVVFVQETENRFRPRKVAIETADDRHYNIISGLAGSEQVVVQGSFLLKTELMKSSLGSGCCGLEPGA